MWEDVSEERAFSRQLVLKLSERCSKEFPHPARNLEQNMRTTLIGFARKKVELYLRLNLQ